MTTSPSQMTQVLRRRGGGGDKTIKFLPILNWFSQYCTLDPPLIEREILFSVSTLQVSLQKRNPATTDTAGAREFDRE